jgi:hypothetical protein
MDERTKRRRRQAVITMSLRPSGRGTRTQDAHEDRRILAELLQVHPTWTPFELQEEYYLRGGELHRFDYLLAEVLKDAPRSVRSARWGR